MYSMYVSVMYICIALCGNVCLYNYCIVCQCVCVCVYVHTHTFFKMMHSIQFYKQLYTGNAKYVYLRKQLTDAISDGLYIRLALYHWAKTLPWDVNMVRHSRVA